MKKNITLVGCGNIGSRHLQSLIKFQDKIIINVVEPQIKNQKTAKTLIAKENTKILPTINWFQNILQINQKSDLVIIATNSKGRIDIVSQLLEQGNKRFIIEKIV